MSVTSRFQKLFGLETKGVLGTSDDWMLELFGAMPAISGISVSPRVAMTCAPVHCAVQAISEAIGLLPVHTFKLGEDGTKTPATDHPAYTLLHSAANEWTSASQFREEITRDALLFPHGGFAFINRVDGKPFELIRYNPEINPVAVQYIDSEPFYRVGDVEIPRQNMLHIPSPSFNGWGLVNEGRQVIGLAIALERYADRLMGNGARPSGVLSLKGKPGPADITKAATAWNAAHGGSKSGGTAVIPGEVDWKPLQFTSVDAQFIEMRKFAINEIARLFRVPPHMLFEMDRATWSNVEQMGAEFLTYTLMVWIRRWENEIMLKLFTPEERASYVAEFQTDQFARPDYLALIEALGKAVASRIFNPNEARAMIGKPPYAGGNAFENPNTTTAVLKN